MNTGLPLATAWAMTVGLTPSAERIAWHANDTLTLELSADSLWPYRDSATQRQDATYLLTVRISY